MFISSEFDSGNIECLDSGDPRNIRLRIRQDHNSDFYQWFYFRAANIAGQACRYVIENADGAAYPGGWENYRAVASYDRESWFRVPTSFDGSELVIEHTSSSEQIYFAYFAPYTLERHTNLIARAQSSGRCRAETLGTSLDGQSIDCLQFGQPRAGRKSLWFVARQHPGETMAEWWMEGLINRLLDEADPVAAALIEKAVIYLVPNMNPDGSRRGHLRTNANGANLNREWDKASSQNSPEVLCVLEKMTQTGVDFAMDIHGDEALPYNFIAGTEGVPSWNAGRQHQLDTFKQTLAALNPDFQTAQGYPANTPGNANLSYCSNALAERFGALVMTLEMPFKDTTATPDERQGWNPQRCAKLAHSVLDTVHLAWDEVIAK